MGHGPGHSQSSYLSGPRPRSESFLATPIHRLDPQYADVYAMSGLAYHALGQYERAIQDLTEVPEGN